MTMSSLFAIAAGGMIGALLRHGFSVLFPPDPGRFPLTTFFENIIGAFLLGLLLVLILERWPPTRHLHPFLCTGVLGSFTTFSLFSYELVDLGKDGHLPAAMLYIGLSLFAGLLAALLGMSLARAWPRMRAREQAREESL
jgi:fluoride exporter